MRRRAPFPPSGGFTLLEVLLALGIFGLAVVGMMEALNSALEAARDARLEQIARTQLENRLAILQGEPLRATERRVDQSEPRMTFTESIQPERIITPDRRTLDGLWRIKAAVQWKVGGEERREESSFLRYGP